MGTAAGYHLPAVLQNSPPWRAFRNYVGAIERGEINPTLRVMLKLTRGLDVPLSKLISDYEALRRERR